MNAHRNAWRIALFFPLLTLACGGRDRSDDERVASTSEPVVCKVGSTSPACTVGGNGGALPVVEYETAAVAPTTRSPSAT
jgi:hypothetical protein